MGSHVMMGGIPVSAVTVLEFIMHHMALATAEAVAHDQPINASSYTFQTC